MIFYLRFKNHLTLLGMLALILIANVAHAVSLTTLFATNNSNSLNGIVYFDLNVLPPGGATITGIATNVLSAGAPVTATANIYVRTGTFSGHTSSASGWTLISSGSGTVAAQDSPTTFNISSFLLNPGVTGFAINNVNYKAAYTNGTGINQNYSDLNIQLSTGAASNSVFSATLNTPRVWNGTITYSIVPEPGAIALLLGIATTGSLLAFRRILRI